MTIFADTHCHLDHYPEALKVARECDMRAIRTIAVTNLPNTWESSTKLFRGFRHIRVALGFHPQLVAENIHETDLFLRKIGGARYIGEVGLDGSKEVAYTLPQQKQVFEKILRACSEYEGKVITVHSRSAVSDVIKMLEVWLPGKRNRVILHWFTGNQKQMLIGLNLGCYFSVNPQMVKSQSGRKLISQIPPDRILTESDGPFVCFKKGPAKPWHVHNVISELAIIWQINSQQAADRVALNFKSLLKAVPLDKS